MTVKLRVLGIDWATKPANRAAVELAGRRIVNVVHPFTDEDAIAALNREDVDVIAVDTPLGWPAGFSQFVEGWSATEGGAPPPEGSAFSMRLTDLVVRQEVGKVPLSVSSDRIALCARSWVEVFVRAGAAGRVDAGQTPTPARPVIEVYPAAALAQFDVAPDGYKKAKVARRALLSKVLRRFALDDGGHLPALVGSKDDDAHVADALLAGLSGLAWGGALKGWGVRRPKAGERAAAAREGWIFFPQVIS